MVPFLQGISDFTLLVHAAWSRITCRG